MNELTRRLFKGSWKTSAGGVALILTTLGDALTSLTDGNSITNPNWTLVLGNIAAGIALLKARDNDKSKALRLWDAARRKLQEMAREELGVGSGIRTGSYVIKKCIGRNAR